MTELRLADRYELGPVIGRGGMGQVRRARDLRLGRDVAIKLLRLDLSSPADRERFEREARAAARVNHPNVVAVYDVGDEGDEVYIVMECLPGTTLADDIAQGPLPVDRVGRIAQDLLGALAAAHDQGVLHRDIKPGNVLLTDDGTAKLGDFGIAKLGEDTDLTEIGTVVGTAAYLPPERLHGRPATEAGDLYSMGVLLYEALAGTRPFAGGSPVEIAHAIAATAPPAIEAIRPDCPPALAGAIGRAMHKDPQLRFASARSMADAIAEGATRVMPPPLPPATRPMATAPLLADAATTVADAAHRAPPLPPTVALPVASDAGPPRRRLALVAALAALVVGILVLGLIAARPGSEPVGPATTDAPVTSSSSTAPPTSPPASEVAPTTSVVAPVTTTSDPRPDKGKGKGEGKKG